ncbi:MAG: type II secretion system protein GspG [Verrucomicrobiota bacterium]
MVELNKAKSNARAHITFVRLQMYANAFNKYHTMFGSWPSTVAELTNNQSAIVFVAEPRGFTDAWGRPMHFRPYSATAGHGILLSFGRDGREGGVGLDADIVFYFPHGESRLPSRP